MRPASLLLGTLLFVGMVPLSVSAEEYDYDWSKMTKEELDNFQSDINNAIDSYHNVHSDDRTSVKNAVVDEVESYYSDSDIDWPWFDYDYTKNWDYYTFSSHMNHREGEDSKQRADIYAELYWQDGDYEIYYLTAGDEIIIDRRDDLPEQKWSETPSAIINETTGLDLSILSEEELKELKGKINDEISADHSTDSSINKQVLSLTKDLVDQRYNVVSWPWFDYTYTNDWGFYTLNTPVSYKDSNDVKQKADVYAEAYPEDGNYELYYLSVGDDVLIDKREELPEDLSLPEMVETNLENSEGIDFAETVEQETLGTEPGIEEQELNTENETENSSGVQTEQNFVASAPDSVLSGTIIEATMNSITVQTDDGTIYTCLTDNAEFDLDSGGIMIGMNVDVTLDNSESDENGFFSADYVTDKTDAASENESAQEESIEELTETVQENASGDSTEGSAKANEKTETDEEIVLYENGSRGDEIKEIQEKLIELGFLSSSADGIFGNGTEAALREFQEENGLEVTGTVTRGTLTALNANSASEENFTYKLAFINPGESDSTYFMFDTDSKIALFFDIIDGSVMKGEYTGEFSEGVVIDWSEYEEGWHEKFLYEEGSSTATLTDYIGLEYEYAVCDVETARKVLETKPGYQTEDNNDSEILAGSEETAEERESEAMDTATSSVNDDEDYSGGRYEGWALTSMKNMAEAVYPYGVKFHTFDSGSAIRYEGDGIWYVKQKVDITNEYGAERSAYLECYVDFVENTVKDFRETE